MKWIMAEIFLTAGENGLISPAPRLNGETPGSLSRVYHPRPRTDFYSMGTTLERNKNRSRPKKAAGKKARRQRDQKKRLIALGMDEKAVGQMSSRAVLTALKHPK